MTTLLVNHKELKKIIKRHYETKVPLDVKGPTGIGKSMQVRETAIEIAKSKEFIEWNEISDEEKMKLWKDPNIGRTFIFADIRISQNDPTDIKGLPSLNGDYVHWRSPLLYKVLSQQGADGILFYDECNLASHMVLASLYQVINDHAAGEIPIAKDVLIISAGNRTSDFAAVIDEPIPLKNRRGNVELKAPTADEWIEWGIQPDIAIDGRILTFLKFKPSYIFRFDKNQQDSSFPTPRSLHKLSCMITGIENLEEVELYAADMVGEAFSIEFTKYLQLQKKIDIDTILRNPKMVKDIKENEMKYSLLGGVVEKYRANPKILDKVAEVADYLDTEFGIFLLRMVKGVREREFVANIPKVKNWDSLREKHGRFIYEEK